MRITVTLQIETDVDHHARRGQVDAGEALTRILAELRQPRAHRLQPEWLGRVVEASAVIDLSNQQ